MPGPEPSEATKDIRAFMFVLTERPNTKYKSLDAIIRKKLVSRTGYTTLFPRFKRKGYSNNKVRDALVNYNHDNVRDDPNGYYGKYKKRIAKELAAEEREVDSDAEDATVGSDNHDDEDVENEAGNGAGKEGRADVENEEGDNLEEDERDAALNNNVLVGDQPGVDGGANVEDGEEFDFGNNGGDMDFEDGLHNEPPAEDVNGEPSAQDIIANLQSDKDRLADEVAALKESLEKARQANSKADSAHSEQMKRLETSHKTELEHAKSRHEELKEANSKFAADAKEYQATVVDLRAQIKNLQSDLAEAGTKMDQSATENDKLLSTLQRQTTDLTAAREEKMKLKAEAAAEVERIKAEMQEAQAAEMNKIQADAQALKMSHTKEVENLTASHHEELARVQDEMEESHKEEMDRVRAEMEALASQALEDKTEELLLLQAEEAEKQRGAANEENAMEKKILIGQRDLQRKISTFLFGSVILLLCLLVFNPFKSLQQQFVNHEKTANLSCPELAPLQDDKNDVIERAQQWVTEIAAEREFSIQRAAAYNWGSLAVLTVVLGILLGLPFICHQRHKHSKKQAVVTENDTSTGTTMLNSGRMSPENSNTTTTTLSEEQQKNESQQQSASGVETNHADERNSRAEHDDKENIDPIFSLVQSSCPHSPTLPRGTEEELLHPIWSPNYKTPKKNKMKKNLDSYGDNCK